MTPRAEVRGENIMLLSALAPIFSTLLFALLLFAPVINAAESVTPKSVVDKMEEAYARIHEYRADVEVKTYKGNGKVDVKRFLFWFKKPDHIRMEFQSPYNGMVIIYPDEEGKVLIHKFMTFRRSIDDPMMLDEKTGQRLDQTGVGPLIDDIARSVGRNRKSPVNMKEDESNVGIRVLAGDPLRPGVENEFKYVIDKRFWLPVEVDESTADGRLIRVTTYGDLRINPAIPDELFTKESLQPFP